jgi:hypothetical protein
VRWRSRSVVALSLVALVRENRPRRLYPNPFPSLQGLKLDRSLARVVDEVMADTGKEQKPAEYQDSWGEKAKDTVLFSP